jgi:hypothetical protein
MAIAALEVAPHPRDELRVDDVVLDELVSDGLARIDERAIVHLEPAGYALLAAERRVRELARPDRHPCRCGAPIPRFQNLCMRCAVSGHLGRIAGGAAFVTGVRAASSR